MILQNNEILLKDYYIIVLLVDSYK